MLSRALSYSPLLYSALVLLNVSLVLRLAGDLLYGLDVRQWGGMLNAIAILLFLFLNARGMIISTRR